MMNKVLIQHGDVILDAVAEIPEGAVPVPVSGDTFILERGEGIHTHTVTAGIGALCDAIDVYEMDGIMYVRAKRDATLDHEEHGRQTLRCGQVYRKRIEQQLDYETDEPRRVAD